MEAGERGLVGDSLSTSLSSPQQYNKQYSSEAEEGYRQRVWLSNLKFIEEFDSEREGFSVAMNQFGDLVSPYPALIFPD